MQLYLVLPAKILCNKTQSKQLKKLLTSLFANENAIKSWLNAFYYCFVAKGVNKVKLNQVHHIAIIASDYEKTKEFYVEQLGFQVIREHYRKERDDWKIDLQLGEMELEIFVKANQPKRPNYPEAYGLRHLAFKVENIETVVAELNEKGIETEPIRTDDFTGEKMTFFFDPDGLPLELHE